MLPYQDSTLIALVLACCEDPTHPIEMVSDRIREQEYDELYTYQIGDRVGTIRWYAKMREAGYQLGKMPRCWLTLAVQLRDIGTWEKRE